MKKCKSCQKEIDDKAKKCNHCQSDQRIWFAKHKILTGIFIVILLVTISNSGDKNTKEQKNLNNETQTPIETQQISPTKEVVKPTNIVQPTKKETVKSVEKISSSGVTMSQFNNIKEGMTYNEVVSILGSSGELLSSSDMAGYKTVMYQWKGTSVMGNMNAMFQNDKMITKAQFGLK